MIISEYNNNTQIAQELEGPLFEYLSNSYKSLDANEKKLFVEMVYKDASGSRLNLFFENYRLGDFNARVEAFDFSCKVLDTALRQSGNNLTAIKDLIETIAQFFDISDFFRLIPREQRLSGEAFFDCILRYDSMELKQLMTAILLCTVYKKDAKDDYCEVRLRGFKKILSKIAEGHLDQFEFILAVRNKICEISDLLPDMNIDERFDFLFNIQFGKSFVSELIDRFSIDEALDAEMILKGGRLSHYESMSTAVRAKLLEIDFVKKNIKSGVAAYSRYKEFFYALPENERSGDIDTYLSKLNQESNINEEFAKYRYDFAHDCYSTLSQENKKQVQQGENPIKKYEEYEDRTEMAEKLRIVETTIRVFGTIKGHKRKGRISYSGIFLWAFAFSVLAMLILSLPAVIIPVSIGTGDFAHILERFVYYFKPYLLALPVYVFLLELVSYFAFNRGNRLKRANIITILCGILPIVIFTLSYIFFYYVRIDLPFNL